MVKGLWTSLPFLCLEKETAHLVSHRHWAFAYEGVNFRRCPITRFSLRLNKAIKIGQLTDQERATHQEHWEQEEVQRRKEFDERIQAQCLYDIRPLKRRHFTETRMEQAKQKRRELRKII